MIALGKAWVPVPAFPAVPASAEPDDVKQPKLDRGPRTGTPQVPRPLPPRPSVRPGGLIEVAGPGDAQVASAIREQALACRPVLTGTRWDLAPRELAFSTVTALAEAADEPVVVQGGRPGSTGLLMAAIQVHRYETFRPHLDQGRLIIEVGGVHGSAVRAAVARHPDDLDRASDFASRLIETTARWRPLPPLVLFTTAPDLVVPTRTVAASQWAPPSARMQRTRETAFIAAVFGRFVARDPERCRLACLTGPNADNAEVVAAEALATVVNRRRSEYAELSSL